MKLRPILAIPVTDLGRGEGVIVPGEADVTRQIDVVAGVNPQDEIVLRLEVLVKLDAVDARDREHHGADRGTLVRLENAKVQPYRAAAAVETLPG